MQTPNLKDITKAHKLIKPFIHKTPVLSSKAINEITGADIYFKCENFQKVGAFKYRGATHAVLCLSEEALKKGVTTHSSGNHAAALALAARRQNINAYIVMPENAPAVKKAAVKGYGAEIFYCQPTLEAREITLKEVQQKTGATFIHPYDNYNVICGQGTAALEMLLEVSKPDIVMAPVGGGGLLSGTAIATKSIDSSIKVIAAEPKNADDAFRSFHSGHLIPSKNPNTIADGLLTSLSNLTFHIIRNNVDDILVAKEKTIIQAMRIIWERMKIIVEPSSAVPLAVVLENKELFQHKKLGIIISGGNVQLNSLPF